MEMVVCNLQMELGTLGSLLMGYAKVEELIYFKQVKPLPENIIMISAVVMEFADILQAQFIVESIGTVCVMVKVFRNKKTGDSTKVSGKAT